MARSDIQILELSLALKAASQMTGDVTGHPLIVEGEKARARRKRLAGMMAAIKVRRHSPIRLAGVRVADATFFHRRDVRGRRDAIDHGSRLIA
jgi:hypothetical protein